MKDKQIIPGPYVSVDANIIETNAIDFKDTFPSVGLAYDVTKCGDFKVLEILTRTATPRIISCSNKREIEECLKVVGPERIALLNPVKPASHIKYGLNHGVKIYGCGTVQELSKVQRWAEQLGSEDVHVMITLDCSGAENHNVLQDRALDILQHSREGNLNVIGVSLFDNSPAIMLRNLDGDAAKYQDSVKKLIATARLVFEAGAKMGSEMKIFDIGHILDLEEGTEELGRIGSNNVWEQFNSQFSSYNFGTGAGMATLDVLCHVTNRFLRKTLTLSVEIICKFMNKNKPSVVINESIYGAFQGILAGDVCKMITSNAKGCDEISIDIFGDSGDDIDVIARDVRVPDNLKVGDQLFFPNLGSAASFGLGDGLPISFLNSDEKDKVLMPATNSGALTSDGSCDMTLYEEFEDAFALPDISDDSLENLLGKHA